MKMNEFYSNDEWKGGNAKKVKSSPSKNEEKNFLALATEILQRAKEGGAEVPSSETMSDGGIRLKNGRELKAWRFENPTNAKTKTLKDGTVMKWCSNDCHPKPMWCGRENCVNRAEYAARNGGRKKGEQAEKSKHNGNAGVSEDFKIALAAMTSNQDFETLKSQFFPGN